MIKIFPLHDAANAMEEKYRQYLQLGKMPLHSLIFQMGDSSEYVTVENPPKLFEWSDLIVAYLKDFVNQSMYWASNTTYYEEALAQVFPHYIAEGKTERETKPNYHEILAESESLYVAVLSQLEEIVHEWLEDHIFETEDDHWTMCAIEPLGEDVLVRKGRDFRIEDWERRMGSGEWKRK